MGRFTFETLRRIVLEHPEHEFYFLFDRVYDDSFIFADNVTPIVVPPPTRHVILIWFWFEMMLPRILKKIQADVFVSTDNILSLRTKVPTVLVTHDLAYEHFPETITPLVRRYYQHFAPKFNSKADKIVAVSEYTKQDLINTYDISGDKIAVACNGCSDGFRALTLAEKEETKSKFAKRKEYFFYVGAVHPRKNVHRLIEAFDAFKKETKSDFKLLIGGRFAWQTGTVTDAYENAEFKKDIEFIGFVKEEDLPYLTGAAFCFVYPSLFEGFGIPVLEAMHCEVPIVTSNVSSLPEVAGTAALKVTPDDVNALKDALLSIYKNEILRNNLVKEARQQREKFSWERAAEVLWDSVDSLLP